jgi:hypothetical protein
MPVVLSVAEHAQIETSARPLDARCRALFVEAVLAELENVEVCGPGTVFRVCASLQKQHWDAPTGPRGPGIGHFDTRPSKLRSGSPIA